MATFTLRPPNPICFWHSALISAQEHFLFFVSKNVDIQSWSVTLQLPPVTLQAPSVILPPPSVALQLPLVALQVPLTSPHLTPPHFTSLHLTTPQTAIPHYATLHDATPRHATPHNDTTQHLSHYVNLWHPTPPQHIKAHSTTRQPQRRLHSETKQHDLRTVILSHGLDLSHNSRLFFSAQGKEV